jgi:outer membrane lipoprotein SlyB
MTKPPTRFPGIAVALAAALAAGCAARQPVLYHNAAYAEAPATADESVGQCMREGETYGTPEVVPPVARDTVIGTIVGAAGGAVGGAIWGNPGIGAASGAAAGAVSSLIFSAIQPRDPNPAYKAGVTRCLQDRGYEVIAWQ